MKQRRTTMRLRLDYSLQRQFWHDIRCRECLFLCLEIFGAGTLSNPDCSFSPAEQRYSIQRQLWHDTRCCECLFLCLEMFHGRTLSNPDCSCSPAEQRYLLERQFWHDTPGDFQSQRFRGRKSHGSSEHPDDERYQKSFDSVDDLDPELFRPPNERPNMEPKSEPMLQKIWQPPKTTPMPLSAAIHQFNNFGLERATQPPNSNRLPPTYSTDHDSSG